MQTEVRDALQAMLDEKHAGVKVEVVDAPSTDTMPETLHFRVGSPAVVLTNVKLAGLTTTTATALRDSLKKVVGQPYNEGLGSALDDLLLSPFRKDGYLVRPFRTCNARPCLSRAVRLAS